MMVIHVNESYIDLTLEDLTPEDLARRAVIEVASLPERDLLVVLEVIADLKHHMQTKVERRARDAEILTRAKQRSKELKHLPREEIMTRFNTATERIREQAIAQGTGLDEYWEND
jgi:hypothetical protein